MDSVCGKLTDKTGQGDLEGEEHLSGGCREGVFLKLNLVLSLIRKIPEAGGPARRRCSDRCNDLRGSSERI